MAGGLAAGAAMGAAFEGLSKSVVHATHKLALFTSDLERLSSTLSSIELFIDDIDNFNRILKRPQHETEAFTKRLEQGKKLIRKCSKVKWWNVLARLYYSKKLSNLEASLLNLFQIDVAALHFRESKRISCVLTTLEEKLNEFATIMVGRSRSTESNSEDSPAEIVVPNAVEFLAPKTCGEIVKIEGSFTY